MALVLAMLIFFAILLSGNIADSVSFKSSFARTENPPKTALYPKNQHCRNAFQRSLTGLLI